MRALAETLVGLPVAASLVAVSVVAQGLREGRRRNALNRALHELRRPLQAIALAGAPGWREDGAVESSVRMAAAALERLDREVNGVRKVPLPPEPIELRALVEAAVRRWRPRAKLAGGSLRLRWRAGRPVLLGDRTALAGALDNLIVNAIEHGGASIWVDARPHRGGVRIVVADSGRASPSGSRRDVAGEALARLSGRRRHGHGLSVVREAAARHGGRFTLRRSRRGSIAALELPLGDGDTPLAA